MSRLYGAKVDERRWKIVETDNEIYHSYKLIDTEKKENYFLNNIIGIEQATDDEFLVFRRVNRNEFGIDRCKLQDSAITILFSKSFSRFYFISDDRIMFTYWGNIGPYRCGGIYSIKNNKILEEAKWLNGAAIEVYIDDENQNEIKLYVEKALSSYILHSPKLLFTVNPDTLQPNSDCYSQLRDSFIKVNSKEDIKIIELEEQKNIRIIEEQICQQNYQQLQNAKEKVLVRKKE